MFKDSLMERALRRGLEQAKQGVYGTPEKPRRGAGHRCAFWDGYFGKRSMYNDRGCLGYASYKAGVIYRRDAAKSGDQR